MTEMTATERLPSRLRRLIDARLDTIDRMLLGKMPRTERLAVTRDVEGQLYDLLSERPGQELSREDVLAVLANLDPPEAYIPEEESLESPLVLPLRTCDRADRGAARKPSREVGILGLMLLGLVVLWPVTFLLAPVIGDAVGILLLGESLIMVAMGVPVFVMSIVWRGGGWATLGMVAGALGVFAGLATVAPFFAV